MRKLVFIGCLFCWGLSLQAQDQVRDSVIAAAQADTLISTVDSLISFLPDSAKQKKGFFTNIFFPGPRPPFDPEVAWKRSLLVPGWGQIYNRDFWKLAFVYGGYVGVGLVIQFNDSRYKEFRQAFIERNDDDPENDNASFPETVSTEGIKRARDNARQDRDLSIIAVAGMHLLQTIEAYVDAHLRGFDVSDDLSLDLHPDVGGNSPVGAQSWQPGLTLTWRIGNE
ncbi:MAG: DUF5683 domain-containing protein [Bacteroidota bacterium]